MSQKKNILSNISYLVIFQGINYIVPIILIPLLISRIGIEKYGIVALTQNIMTIFISATTFGLHASALRMVGTKSKSQHNEIYNKVVQSKILTLLIGYIVLIILIYSVPQWNNYTTILHFSYLITVGNVLTPIWFFEATQQMKFIPILNFFAKVIYLLSVYFFIVIEDDFIYVNLLNGLSWIFMAIIATIMVIRRIKFKFIYFSIKEILHFLNTNGKIFISTLLGNIYRNGAIVMADFIFTPYNLGIYAIIEKLLALLNNNLAILNRALIPISNKLSIEGKSKVIDFIFSFMKWAIPLMAVACTLLYFTLPYIFPFIVPNNDINEFSNYFLLISIIPFTVFLSVPINIYLFPLHLDNDFLKFNIILFLSFFVSGYLLGNQFGVKGFLCAFVIAEILGFIYGCIAIKKDLKHA